MKAKRTTQDKLLTWEQWNSATTEQRQNWLDNNYLVPLDEIEREYQNPVDAYLVHIAKAKGEQ